jgi:hypothetical protein
MGWAGVRYGDLMIATRLDLSRAIWDDGTVGYLINVAGDFPHIGGSASGDDAVMSS